MMEALCSSWELTVPSFFCVILVIVIPPYFLFFHRRYGPKGGVRNSYWKDYVAQWPGWFGTAFVAFICFSTSVGYAWLLSECPIPAAVAAFRLGTPKPLSIDCMVPRDSLFSPPMTGGYILLEGPHGCGKTTLIQSTCHKAGPGVLYISVPEDVDSFGISLASLIGFGFTDELTVFRWLSRAVFDPQSGMPSSNKKATARTLSVIRAAGSYLRSEWGRPVVLVIDNMARLARQDLPTFELLHDFAKERADEDNVAVVFSSSEGIVPAIMQGRSSESRLGRIIKLGDIDTSAAVKYLKCRGLANANVVDEVVDLTGGRFTLMISAVRNLQIGSTVDELKRFFFTKVEYKLEALGVSSTPPDKNSDHLHDTRSLLVWWLAERIVRNGFATRSDFNDHFAPQGDKVVVKESNVFLYDSGAHRFYFQSRPDELYMRWQLTATSHLPVDKSNTSVGGETRE